MLGRLPSRDKGDRVPGHGWGMALLQAGWRPLIGGGASRRLPGSWQRATSGGPPRNRPDRGGRTGFAGAGPSIARPRRPETVSDKLGKPSPRE